MKEKHLKPNSSRISDTTSKGFTLIEILVAVIILAVGILTVSQMTVMGMKTSVLIDQQMESRSLLARGMEVIRLLDITDPLLVETAPDSTLLDDTLLAYRADSTNVVGQTIGPTIFNVYWNVTDSIPQSGTKTIRMLVYRGATFFMKADYVKWR
jgi:prepilin-type N-terminal cleavage/methylation domain-containing protein